MENNDNITVLMIAFSAFFVYGLVSLFILFMHTFQVKLFFFLMLFILFTSLVPMLLLGLYLKIVH